MRRLFSLVALAALTLPASAQDAPVPSDRDGIHVVGAWTLTVTDPDGSVVERREFHNDLTADGADFLALLLSQGHTTGDPMVGLLSDPSGTTDLCDSSSFIFNASGLDDGCYITTAEAVIPALTLPYASRDLTVATMESGDGSGRAIGIRLAGSTTVKTTSEIGVVRTFFGACTPDVAPETCTSVLPPGGFNVASNNAFTERNLGGESLAVEAGQTVNVRVEISFE